VIAKLLHFSSCLNNSFWVIVLLECVLFFSFAMLNFLSQFPSPSSLSQNDLFVLTTLVTLNTKQGSHFGLIFMEKVLHAGLRLFAHSGSCNLLYALFIFKQVKHTCCLSLHVYVHCIACNCMFLYVPSWLSSNA